MGQNPGQGNAYGFGMEQPPPQSGFLPNGNAFPGQGQGQPVPMAQPQRPSPQGPPMGSPPAEAGPRQFPREMLAAALNRRPV
jgi:hypothetical protein